MYYSVVKMNGFYFSGFYFKMGGGVIGVVFLLIINDRSFSLDNFIDIFIWFEILI